MQLRYIIFIGFIHLMVSQQLSWGNVDHIIPSQATSQSPSTSSPAFKKADGSKTKKSSKKEGLLPLSNIQQLGAQYNTNSCVDRCHVDYTTYQTMYQEEFFRHRVHSPKQGMECNLCHEKYVADNKPHGNLLIQNKDCITCHHKEVRNEDCLKCHAEIKEYMDGWVQDMITKIPDWMSKDVSCSDCHKLESDGYSFKSVRNYCVECHSPGYGVMYDLWKEILDKEIKPYFETGSNTLDVASQNPNQSSSAVLSAEQINVVAKYLFQDSFVSSLEGGKAEREKKSQKKKFLQLDATNRNNLLRFVQSNGIHNILLSQIILKSIDKDQRHLNDNNAE